MFDVNGKVALVTGGAGGIGLAITEELLRNGVKGVAILDINESLAQEALKKIQNEFGEEKVIFQQIDISERKQFEGAFKKTVEKFGNLDVVVNNAGMFNEVDWERQIQVNLLGTTNGTILAFEEYLPKHKSGEEGIILNISSVSALRMHASAPVYGATKSGILAMTRCLGQAVHYEQKTIKVMALCPGFVRTNITNTLLGPSYVAIQKYHDFNPRPLLLKPEVLGRSAIYVIQEGENGSVWVSEENDLPYEVEIRFERKKPKIIEVLDN